MNIISWNINGYQTCDKYGGFQQILKENPDCICLQEVKISDPENLNTLFTIGYHKYYNFSEQKGHNGVFIYSKEKAIRVISNIGFSRFDSEGRLIGLEFDKLFLINVYMPHGRRDKRDIPYKLKAYDYFKTFICDLLCLNKHIIIVGDFNIAYSEIDLERSNLNAENTMFSQKERDSMKELLSIGLSDAFRQRYPCKREYTWWPYAYKARERNVGWRIDYCLVTSGIYIDDIIIRSDIFGSDHCPVNAMLSIREADS